MGALVMRRLKTRTCILASAAILSSPLTMIGTQPSTAQTLDRPIVTAAQCARLTSENYVICCMAANRDSVLSEEEIEQCPPITTALIRIAIEGNGGRGFLGVIFGGSDGGGGGNGNGGGNGGGGNGNGGGGNGNGGDNGNGGGDGNGGGNNGGTGGGSTNDGGNNGGTGGGSTNGGGNNGGTGGGSTNGDSTGGASGAGGAAGGAGGAN